MIADRISAENFNAILAKSQAEQKALRDRLHHNQNRVEHERQEQDDTARWIELIKECADIQELDTATLQRLIKTIVIHEDLDGDMILTSVSAAAKRLSTVGARCPETTGNTALELRAYPK